MLNLVSSSVMAFTDAQAESGSILTLLLPLLIIGGLFYFMLIMPQRRRVKTLNEMRDSVAVGDEIRTVGGIYGVVQSIDGDEVTIDVGAGTNIRIVKRAIAERLGGGTA